MIGDAGLPAPAKAAGQSGVFGEPRYGLSAGDLVNRGPDSLGVVRWAQAAGSSARCILGNHDLHLLAVAHGIRKAPPQRHAGPLLQAPDAPALLNWLRQQPLARLEHGWLMVHAGVLPQWSAEETVALSAEFTRAMGA